MTERNVLARLRDALLGSRAAPWRIARITLMILVLVVPLVYFGAIQAPAQAAVLAGEGGPQPHAPKTRRPTKTPAPPSATRTPTNTPVPTDTPVPGSCTPTTLSKGPTLILTGNETEMKVFWQWTANATFQLRWSADTTYGSTSGALSAYDTTNHLYQYTIAGLTPGAKYYYRAEVGTQCAGGSFYAPAPASATAVKFFAYGDTRTQIDVHDGLAGQVVSRFRSDPAFQTLTLNVGDWVNGDLDSAWSAEWFSPNYANIREQDANIVETGVRGNHEGAGTYFKRYWPQPYQQGGFYRSFDYGPMHIVELDQYTSYTAGSTQYNWLQNDLANSTKTWKFVVLHEPGWSAGGSHPNNTTVQTVLQPLFRQYGVSIVFGGHNHYYARAVVDGIQHLTVGGGGAPLYAPDRTMPYIVTASQSYSFGEFSIAGNTLSAQVIDNRGGLIDSFTITR